MHPQADPEADLEALDPEEARLLDETWTQCTIVMDRQDRVLDMPRHELEAKGVAEEVDALSAHSGTGNMQEFARVQSCWHRIFELFGMTDEGEQPVLATSKGQPPMGPAISWPRPAWHLVLQLAFEFQHAWHSPSPCLACSI